MRRTRRWTDEKLLRRLGRMQMLVRYFDGRGLAEVDARAAAHDGFAVEELADRDGGRGGVEGDNDAAEGF